MSQTGSVEETSASPDLKPDLTLFGGAPPTRTNRFPKRGNSAVKMLSEEHHLDTDPPSRRASTPEKRTLRNSVVRLLESQDFARRFSAPEKTRSRRSSSIVKTLSEEQEDIELSSRRSSRSGSIVKMTSEDNFADDELSRRSSRADFPENFEKRKSVRRGSSVVRMLSEEHPDITVEKPSRSESERSENAEKFRKSIDSNYKHSLESISEYKTKTFSSNTIYPSLDSPTLDCLSEFAQSIMSGAKESDRTSVSSSANYLSWLETVNSEHYGAPHASDNESKSGEWNYFWSNYNNSGNEYFSSPYLCPSNSVDELSVDSNCSTQRDKSGLEKVVFTFDEVNEALHCAQRVTDILKDALKRSEDNCYKNNSFKEEDKKSQHNEEKPEQKTSSANSCIEVFLNNTGVADILKKVLSKRRDVLMPPEESSRSSGSGWTSFDSSRK